MMVRFIFGCAFFLALSVMAVPVFYGVKEKKEIITASVTTVQENDSLTFEEIYELAAEDQDTSPTSLNDITPAAGGKEDGFSSGFQNKENPALTDNPVETMVETETSEQ